MIDRRDQPRALYGAWVQSASRRNPPAFYLADGLTPTGLLLRGRRRAGEPLQLRLLVENERTVMAMNGLVSRDEQKEGMFFVRFVDVDPCSRAFLIDLTNEARLDS